MIREFLAAKVFVILISTWFILPQEPIVAAQAPTADELQAAIFVDRAVIAFNGKKYDEALEELQRALRLDPRNVDALYYQGLVYLALHRPLEARDALEKAREIQPGDLDVAFQLGVFYFSRKEYDKAEPPLREVYGGEPQRPNIGFYLGVIEYHKRNYREALIYLRANVPRDDSFAQIADVYTGLTVAALGYPHQASAEIQQALRRQPVSPLVTPAQRLGEIFARAEEEERSFRGELRLGAFYDTNVQVVPNSSRDASATTVRRNTTRRKSEGQMANLKVAYNWLSHPDWEGEVSYRFLYTYNNRLADFNTQFHTPTLGVVHRGSLSSPFGELPYDAGLQLTYDFISLGNAPFTQRWIVSPFLRLVNPGNLTTLQYHFQLKDFYGDDRVVRSEVRDAKNYIVGLTHAFLFEEGRHFLWLGYQYDAELAEGKNWRYRGQRLLAGLQYTLPWWDVRVRYDLDFHWRFYNRNHTLLPANAPNSVKRRDWEPIHQVGIAKDFLKDFTLAVEYLYDQTNSNLALYRYDRHIVTTSVAWRF